MPNYLDAPDSSDADAPKEDVNRSADTTPGDDRPSASAIETSLRRAARLSGPPALAALAAALVALQDGGVLRAAIGVAIGTLLGAGVAGYLATLRRIERETPAAPLTRVEEVGGSATAAAALLGGPAASLSEAISDARLILERLPVALLLLDAKGRVVFANHAADEEIGRRSLGEHFSSALRAPTLAEAIREAYAGAAAVEVDFTQRRFQERFMHATVQSLLAAPAAATEEAEIFGHARIAVLLQDQTPIRRAEQLHRDFVANASHELKTPIAAIAGFVETLRGPAKDDVEAHERFLRIMAQQAERMRRLVEDLLSLNRIELNEHVPPRETLDLSALLERTARQNPEFELGRIELQSPPADRPRKVRGDSGQLEQLFTNLIENALKYGGDGAPVRLSVEERSAPRRQIGVTVEDSGPGIPREHIRRLTERFYRVEDQPGKLKSGTGLGLSIVKHVVSRHRGALEIDSRPGRGSRFTVWLPPAEDFEGAPPSSFPEPEDPAD